MSLQLEINDYSNIKELALKGALNSATSKEAEEKLKQLILGGNKVLLVNLSELEYISSAGLRILLVANKLIKKHEGSLRIHSLQKIVREVFEISGFDMIFEIYEDRNTALNINPT